MAVSFGRLRQIALAMIGVGSVLAGLVFAFRLVTPALIVQLPTPELVGLLGLLVLPPVTAWSLWADRNARAHIPAPAVDETPVASSRGGAARDEFEGHLGTDVELVAEQVIEPEVHAPGRRAVRHRRQDPTRIDAARIEPARIDPARANS